jgi:GxxExxY protein
MKLHSALGNGFLELIYQRSLSIEMETAGLKFQREYEMPVYYNKQLVGTRRVDFIVDNIVSLELKALTKLEGVHPAQAINYLEAYDLELGLLINFEAKSSEFKRIINCKFKQKKSK